MKIFNCDEVQLNKFFLLLIMLLLSYIRTLCPTQGHEDFLLKVLVLTFRSTIRFELIFRYGVR